MAQRCHLTFSEWNIPHVKWGEVAVPITEVIFEETHKGNLSTIVPLTTVVGML